MERLLHQLNVLWTIKLKEIDTVVLRGCMVFILVITGLTSQATVKESVVSLVDENRVITTAVELHITSDNAPLTNSTVSLNHEDAWLFFDNIKPSVVISDYLSSVLVNGEAFVEGTNGRVAIYAHGTVLMPHSTSYKPLTVYTGENFTGESTQYGIHTYYTSLGNFDNAIKSFKLKRGYMATLANESDGSGYSRVFIADESDKEFAIAPAELNGSVSFIRVFKYQWVTKKGWCGWNWDEYQMTNSTWYYDWNVGGSSSSNVEYSVIRQNAGWPGWTDINDKQDITHLLGYNEPDHTEQSDITVDEAIAMWPSFMNSGLRIGSPATTNFNWLYDFIDKCDALNYRVDYVAVHSYWGSSASSYYNTLKYVHERTGRPIWVTEWNYGANWTSEWWPDDPSSYTTNNADYALTHISEIVNMFDTCHFIERYSIYNWVEDARAIVLGGELTKAGQFYADNNSVIAYDSQNEVIPHWNYQVPTLSYRYLSLSNSIKLSWQDTNGELGRGYKIEKKVNDGAFETIYSSEDVYTLSYLDGLDAGISGKITYKVSTKTSNGDYVSSETVSYYQTGGANDVQVANLDVKSTDWSTCLFSKKYSTAPVAFLGMPTFSNISAVSKRVNSVLTTSFKFILDPWSYLNNPAMTNSDNISALALPIGNYDFNGIKGEVATVADVSRDWVTVTFNQPFESVPVVFCSQTSNSTPFPTAVAIRNVTNTSFEMSLISEEAITNTIFPEKVNYFAVEEGNGVMDGKRFTVGKVSGLTSSTMIVDYDETYSEPAFFGELQTLENDFACTVRYYQYTANSIKILKQREMSGGLASILPDDAGWMIMDINPNQVITSIGDQPELDYDFYPNPTDGIIYFNLDQDTKIEVFDITGQKQSETVSSTSIDISYLPSGVYLLKIGDAKIRKIIRK